MTDSELIVEIGRGDEAAYRMLYERWKPLLVGLIIRRHPRLRSDAEDIAQEVLLRVWKAAPRFDGSRGSARAWIWTIAVNDANDRERAATVRARSLARLTGDEIDSSPTALDSLLSSEWSRDRMVALFSRRGMTPPRLMTLLAVAEHPDWTRAQYAEALSMNLNTFGTHLYRARQTARRALARHG